MTPFVGYATVVIRDLAGPMAAAERFQQGVEQSVARGNYAGCISGLLGKDEWQVNFPDEQRGWRMGWLREGNM